MLFKIYQTKPKPERQFCEVIYARTLTPYSHQQQPKSMDLDKAKGIIYGLAIGDALGRLTEFKSLPQIKSEYVKEGITDLPEPPLYTDDTQMSVAIAEHPAMPASQVLPIWNKASTRRLSENALFPQLCVILKK